MEKLSNDMYVLKARYFQKTGHIIFLPFSQTFLNVSDISAESTESDSEVSKIQKSSPKRQKYDLTSFFENASH